jgi:hypothetical protein
VTVLLAVSYSPARSDNAVRTGSSALIRLTQRPRGAVLNVVAKAWVDP